MYGAKFLRPSTYWIFQKIYKQLFVELSYTCVAKAYSHSFQIVGRLVVINLGFLFFFPSLQPPCAWNIIFTIAFVYNIHDLYRQFRMKVLIQLSLGQWYIRLFKFVFGRFYWFPRKYEKTEELYTLARLVRIFFSKARNWRSHRVETSRTARSIVRYHVFHLRSRLNASQNKSQVSTDCSSSVT